MMMQSWYQHVRGVVWNYQPGEDESKFTRGAYRWQIPWDVGTDIKIQQDLFYLILNDLKKEGGYYFRDYFIAA